MEDGKIKQVRRSRTDEMYGITRSVIKLNLTNDVKDKKIAAFFWNVRILKVSEQKNLVPSFPPKRFFDKDYEGTDDEKKEAALADAKKYRNKELLTLGINTKKIELKYTSKKKEITFTKNLSRIDNSMLGITRDNRSEHKGSSGWRVRVKGIQAYFSDGVYGSETDSLAAAKDIRDQINKPPTPIIPELSVELKKTRLKANISQDMAGMWMGVGHITFSRMERGLSIPKESFLELFKEYTDKKLDPFEKLPKPDLKELRFKLHKTQAQMSKMITGVESQTPWYGWEIGHASIPEWVHKYIIQIMLRDIKH